MMQENLAEPQDDKDPNAIHIPEYRRLFSKLPRLGVSIELHEQNKPRSMACCHQTTLTQLGEWLTRTLKAMSIESEEVWKDTLMTAGAIATSSWAISSNGQVQPRMDEMETTQGSLMATHHGTSRLTTSLKCTQLLSWSHHQGMKAKTVAA